MSKVEINLKNGGRNGSFVKIDGKEVTGITSLTLEAKVGEPPRIVIDLLSLDGHFVVEETETEIRAHTVTTNRRGVESALDEAGRVRS